ncbi:MAG: protein kinase [Candidatus Hydrogenedens sp.]|nr:protein kinase [Candidatus Hydrogenedens sp.]
MAESAPRQFGRYQIVRELGKGAMGIVYEGRDPNINRRVAIKTARRDVMEASGMAEEMMERFLREAQSAGSLNHPNIITIYDAGEENDVAWMAMEFLEGRDLRHMLKDHIALTQEEIATIGAEVCEGLAVAHDHAIIHRDVKPANIMVLTNGGVKITDFGIAHVADSNLTLDGALIGTPHYMSPEQFMGQTVDPRTDLFALGITLYELVTGEKPFNGEAMSTVMHQVIKSSPVEPKELNLNVTDALSAVIMKALSKRPQDRYQDARVMARALRECLKPDPDPAIIGSSESWKEAPGTSVSHSGHASSLSGLRHELMSDTSSTVTLVNAKDKQPKPGSGTAEKDAVVLPTRMLLAAAATALAAVVIAGVVFFWLGRSASGSPAANAAPAAAEATKVPVEAHYTTDSNVWLAFSEITDPAERAAFVDEKTHDGKIQPLSGGKVYAYNGDTGDLLAQEDIDQDGEATNLLDIQGAPASVRYKVEAELGDGNKTDEFVLVGKEFWSKRQVFLLYN